MDTICAWLIIGCVAWFCYTKGKRLGSRKGFHAGRRHRRR
jgi:hypothetical protein